MMTHLSLFSGIGGLDLAAEAAGFVTVGQCEWADYPTMILERHWPDVPRWRDIRTLTGESFYERTGLRTVDVVSGGFPCQPFSVAGKQKGKGDDRYLWPEMLRVIRELTPRWVVGENVPGILQIAAADVVQDLEREGYDVVVFDFEAAAVGAPHRRERIAFVANAGSGRRGQQSIPNKQQRGTETERTGEAIPDREGTRGGEVSVRPRRPDEKKTDADRSCDDVPHTEMRWEQRQRSEWFETWRFSWRNWWTVEPDVGRVAYGIPNRVDRLKCLGNAVVPMQFYPIFEAIVKELSEDG